MKDFADRGTDLRVSFSEMREGASKQREAEWAEAERVSVYIFHTGDNFCPPMLYLGDAMCQGSTRAKQKGERCVPSQCKCEEKTAQAYKCYGATIPSWPGASTGV